MNITHVYRAGFSLIEVLVYIAVTLFITIGSIGLIFSLQELLTMYKAEQILLRTHTNILEHVSLVAKNASDINTLNSVLGTTLSTVEIVTSDGAMIYSIYNNRLSVSDNGATPVPLSDSRATVDAFIVTVRDSGISQMISIELALSVTVGTKTVSKTMHLSKMLQGSYD